MFLWIQISGCVSDRKGNQRVTSFPMADVNQSRSQMIASTKQDAVVSYNEMLVDELIKPTAFIIIFSSRDSERFYLESTFLS